MFKLDAIKSILRLGRTLPCADRYMAKHIEIDCHWTLKVVDRITRIGRLEVEHD